MRLPGNLPLGGFIVLSLAACLTNCGESSQAEDDEDPSAGEAGGGGSAATGGLAGASDGGGDSGGESGADALGGQGGAGDAGRGGASGAGGSAGKGGGSAGKGGGVGGSGGGAGGTGGTGGNGGTSAAAGSAGSAGAGSGGTAGSGSHTVTFIWGEYRESLTDAASYSFPAVSLAYPGPDRLVVVVTHSASNVAVTYDAVTIGGVAAQKVASVGEELEPTAPTAFFVARLPTGDVADIQMDLSATVVRGAIAVYAIYGVSSLVPFDWGTSRAMNGGSIPIDVPQGGIVLAALGMAADTNGEAGWGTGLYELYDTVMVEGTPTHVAGAFGHAVSAGTFDVGIYTVSAGYETRAVAVSFY